MFLKKARRIVFIDNKYGLFLKEVVLKIWIKWQIKHKEIIINNKNIHLLLGFASCLCSASAKFTYI